MRCLVDTNILMDVYLDRTPFSEPAELMLALGLVGEPERGVDYRLIDL